MQANYFEKTTQGSQMESSYKICLHHRNFLEKFNASSEKVQKIPCNMDNLPASNKILENFNAFAIIFREYPCNMENFLRTASNKPNSC